MYSHIFVAVDDSEPSLLAMEEAIKLAKDQGAKLGMIYVAEMFIPAGEGIPIDFKKHEEEIIEKGKAILKKMLALAHHSNIPVETQIMKVIDSERHIAETIVKEAENWHADLIVLGTHGRSGLSRLLLGSTAEEVIRKTSIPVHLVRNAE